MAFVHEDSCECVKTELDLFSIPPTQTSVENGNWIEYHPLTTVGDGSPIQFDIAHCWERRRLYRFNQHDAVRAGQDNEAGR